MHIFCELPILPIQSERSKSMKQFMPGITQTSNCDKILYVLTDVFLNLRIIIKKCWIVYWFKGLCFLVTFCCNLFNQIFFFSRLRDGLKHQIWTEFNRGPTNLLYPHSLHALSALIEKFYIYIVCTDIHTHTNLIHGLFFRSEMSNTTLTHHSIYYNAACLYQIGLVCIFSGRINLPISIFQLWPRTQLHFQEATSIMCSLPVLLTATIVPSFIGH